MYYLVLNALINLLFLNIVNIYIVLLKQIKIFNNNEYINHYKIYQSINWFY